MVASFCLISPLLDRDANLAICGAQITNRFDCLSCTLEMPYKDTLDFPEPTDGWSPQRCEKLGASMLDAM